MAGKTFSNILDLQDILTESAEVQLAAFNAGIEFWSKWVKQTEGLSKNMEKNLNNLKNNPEKPIDILLEMNDTNREYLRDLKSLPRDIASKFISEVDRLRKTRNAAASQSKADPKRRARAKQ